MNEAIYSISKLLADNVGNKLTVALADGIILHTQQIISKLEKPAENLPENPPAEIAEE